MRTQKEIHLAFGLMWQAKCDPGSGRSYRMTIRRGKWPHLPPKGFRKATHHQTVNNNAVLNCFACLVFITAIKDSAFEPKSLNKVENQTHLLPIIKQHENLVCCANVSPKLKIKYEYFWIHSKKMAL